ncbi:hypothetical protein DV738_g5270, partial [Chaetothyriales sp. CBS 135597]
MLFSSLYSMLPQSKNYLIDGGYSPQQASFLLIGLFMVGVVTIRLLSSVLHQFMPSHVVDCDHTHDENEIKNDDSDARGRELGFPHGGKHATSVQEAHETTPLLDHPAPTDPDHSPATVVDSSGFTTAPTSRKPSMKPRSLTRTLTKYVSGRKENCDESGPCMGFSDPCGQDCFKIVQHRATALPSPATQSRASTWSWRKPSASLKPVGPVRELDEESAPNGYPPIQASGSKCDTRLAVHTPAASVRSRSVTHHHHLEHDHLDASGQAERRDSGVGQSKGQEHHHHVPTNAFMSIGLQTSIAIALHKAPEGFITYATNHANPSLGFAVFMALFIHNITEGFVMSLPLYLALHSRLKAILWASFLGGASQPLGAAVAALWFKLAGRTPLGAPDEKVYGAMFALTSGVMTSVALSLFSESVQLSHNKSTYIVFAFIGMGILGLSSALTAKLSQVLQDALSWKSSTSSLMVSATNGAILSYAFKGPTPGIKELRTMSTTVTAAYAIASEDVLIFEAQVSRALSVIVPHEGPEWTFQVGEGTYVLRDDMQLPPPPPHPSESPAANSNPLATSAAPPTAGVKISVVSLQPKRIRPELDKTHTTTSSLLRWKSLGLNNSKDTKEPDRDDGAADSKSEGSLFGSAEGSKNGSAPAFGESNAALAPAAGRDMLKRRKPKNNIIKSNSSFVSRVIPHEALAKKLAERDEGGAFAFVNVNRAFQWLDLSSPAKADPMTKILFTRAHMICHDVNALTKHATHMDVIMGSSASDIIWYEPISQKYARINKNGAINPTAVTKIRWIPGSETHFLASHMDGSLVVYDKEKEDAPFVVNSANQKTNPVAFWKISHQAINDFAFSPDSRHLAVVGEDGYLRIIDYLREKLTDVYCSYYGGFTCVTFSPDGKYVLTGGQDDLISIWSMAERQIIARCPGHASWVTAVAFDPWRCDDSTYRFGSVGEDCKLLLWDFSVSMLNRPKGARSRTQGSVSAQSVSLMRHRTESASMINRMRSDSNRTQSIVNQPELDEEAEFINHEVEPQSRTAQLPPIMVKTIDEHPLCHIRTWNRPREVNNASQLNLSGTTKSSTAMRADQPSGPSTALLLAWPREERIQLSTSDDGWRIRAKHPLQQSFTSTATVATLEQITTASIRRNLLKRAKSKIAGVGVGVGLNNSGRGRQGNKRLLSPEHVRHDNITAERPMAEPPPRRQPTSGESPSGRIGRMEPLEAVESVESSVEPTVGLAAAAAPVDSSASFADRHLLHPPRPRSPASAMALKLLGSHGSSSSNSAVKHFDIRLDNDYIVLRGSEDEAASAHLAGSLVLCLTEPLTVSHIQLTLSGILHMSWSSLSTTHMNGRKVCLKEKTFFEKTWPFMVPGKAKTETLPPDNYEWPFDTILEGSLPESIEGMKDAWIIYRLKAEIGRKRARDIITRKPLRIVRTLDPSALELAHAMSVDNIWPNKIEYSISVPSKAIVFGSFVRVDFKLIPLLKGLVIGAITTEVKEEQELVVDPEWGLASLAGAHSRLERVIAHDAYTLDPDKDEQLRANLPIMLYISPNLPINENNDLVDQSPQAGRAAMENDLANSAPPVYGEHILDKLYSEVDPSGYLTPGVALSSPGTPYLQSRQQSHENLRSLNAITSGGSWHPSPIGSFVSPLALQHRLQNLHVGGQTPPSHPTDDSDGVAQAPEDGSGRRSDPHTPNEDYSSSHGTHQAWTAECQTQASSSVVSRRASEEEDGSTNSGARTPFPQFAHMEDLSRVPSYTTAVKAGAPRPSPGDGSIPLPTYGAAVTAPIAVPPPAVVGPPIAHAWRGTSPHRNGSVADPGPPARAAGTQSPRNYSPLGSGLLDEERRLRILQLRGR